MGSNLNQFYAKTWILVAYAGGFGLFGLLATLMGVLILCGINLSANGNNSGEIGIPMLVIGIVMLTFAALAILNIVVRRNPILELNRDGLALNVIGRSSLHKVPHVPNIALVFRQQRLWAPWAAVRSVEMTGHSMARMLTIQADFYESSKSWLDQQPPLVGEITFSEGEIDGTLDELAETIRGFARPSY